MLDGGQPSSRRLPFSFQAHGGVGRLALESLTAGPVVIDRLELEVTDLGTDPGGMVAERFQRRRTRLRTLAVRVTAATLEDRVVQVQRHLAGLGLTQLAVRLDDGWIAVRARAADGLAAADVSFRVHIVSAGTHLRALASHVRVHGHLPTPGPVVADRALAVLLNATDTAGVIERPHTRGLCDVEIDLVGALLWHLMPPHGWRLPAVSDVELTHVRIGRGAIEIVYGPQGTRAGELGVLPESARMAAAQDLMHSVDQHVREGNLELAMRGYRALLASGGPDQPLLLERILALASAKPAWSFDGLELARQALARWPQFSAAHSALASITLAHGDAREAASHLAHVAQLASADGDDDQAALAALAGARLLRVLDPKAATLLYQLALEHDPGSAEAADSLADRLADEHRWPELVRLVRARAATTTEPARAVQLRLRLADVLVHHLGDPAGAQEELAVARHLAPDDPAVHEMTASLLSTRDPSAAVAAWREVARLAEIRGDHRTGARAWALLGGAQTGDAAHDAWQRALALDPLQADALAGLAAAAAGRDDHVAAAELYERMRGIGLAQPVMAGHELALARSLVALGRTDDARASLRRAALAGGETAAEAHAVLAELAELAADPELAAAELATAIDALVALSGDHRAAHATRAAELAIVRAKLLDRTDHAGALADWRRAHALADPHAPAIARQAARMLLERTAADDATAQRRWIDAILATAPPAGEQAALLVRRAEVRRRSPAPDLAAALGDTRQAVALLDGSDDEPTRSRALEVTAELCEQRDDARGRGEALTALAKLHERAPDRVLREVTAATAWLAANEPALALGHALRAEAELDADVPAPPRREIEIVVGEAAWRARAWPDAIRAYRGALAEPVDDPRIGTFRYRLAVAADRTGDAATALAALAPLVAPDLASSDGSVEPAAASVHPLEIRGQALRLFADLSERTGDLAAAAPALEGFAAIAVDSPATARADAMFRAGELFRRADRGDDAVRCLEAALRISDSHLPALDALEAAWRERGDLERVSVILGRKVAATGRHPARQKPLLSRLGDLQAQLGRPDVAFATHQRALEIDPTWRPSLRFVSQQLAERGQLAAAAGGLAQLAGELASDQGADPAILARDRTSAAVALAELIAAADDAQLETLRPVARPALERAALDGAGVGEPLGRLRGVRGGAPSADPREDDTQSGRAASAPGTALSLRAAAARARAAGKLGDALASLEAANHVSPGDASVLRELVELAIATADHAAAARHLGALADAEAGAARGATLLELADLCYDHLDDPARGRTAMQAAADAFGAGARRDATLRLLGAEASSHLAWDVAIGALTAIAADRRAAADVVNLATALVRAGRDAQAVALIEAATAAHRFDDGGALLGQLRADVARKAELARGLERRAATAPAGDAAALRDEAKQLRDAIGAGAEPPSEGREAGEPRINGPAHPRTITQPRVTIDARPRPTTPPPRTRPPTGQVPHPRTITRQRTEPGGGAPRPATPTSPPARTITLPGTGEGAAPVATPRTITLPGAALPAPSLPAPSEDAGWQSVSEPELSSVPPAITPSVSVTGTRDEQALAVAAAAASADRDRLLAARREQPDDASVLLALLAHLGERAPALRRAVLDEAVATSHGSALAIALHELAVIARAAHEPSRATALWSRAHDLDPDYAPIWMPLADALAAGDDLDAARELYESVARSDHYDAARRRFAADRADALARDDSIVSGEIGAGKPAQREPRTSEQADATEASDAGDGVPAAIAAALRAVERAGPHETLALERLEGLYVAAGDITAASEVIGRQLVIAQDPAHRALLWRRRARLYRDSMGRDAEAYRCLKEAHACSPADPEISYQLRTAAMVRGEWALAASLLYREIAASANPRDRGALHLELALIFEERLDDEAQAQVNFEQALAFDPTIPAAKLPLARRYETIGRHAEAAKLYEEAAATARAGDRAALLEAAARCRAAAIEPAAKPDLAAQLDRAEAAGDLEAADRLAHELWDADPGHPAAFRVLGTAHRASGELAALTELTAMRVLRAETADERATAWLEVARLAEELGVLDQAARAYDLALSERPSHIGALDARGALAFRLGDFATADLIYRDLGTGESVLGEDELALRRSIIAEHLGRDSEALVHAQAGAAAAPGRRDLMMRVQELATRIGELQIALAAARAVLDLVPLDDDDAQLATHFALVDLQRQNGELDAAVGQLERILRDHPLHAGALESLAEVHIARDDWSTASRFLYQLVPLAPNATERAARLHRLGEAVLVHLEDVDRADDVFLRASDLDPTHVPTLRRLLDVYWRADDPGALVEVATELAARNALVVGPTPAASLAHALVAAALVGDTQLASTIGSALGDEAPTRVAAALAELDGREGRLKLATASTAIAELARRGLLDMSKVRAAAGTGTALARVLS